MKMELKKRSHRCEIRRLWPRLMLNMICVAVRLWLYVLNNT